VLISHPDNIRFHHQYSWDAAFVKKMENAFPKQFLRVGDSVRIISGVVNSEIGMILLMDYAYGESARLELNVNDIHRVTEHHLEDLECIFWVGDQISVVAGVHLGLQGYIVEKTGNIFSICQHLTQEQVCDLILLTLQSNHAVVSSI
jgi:transcription antitermination factor NusG